MKKVCTRIYVLLLILTIILPQTVLIVSAADKTAVDNAVNKTAAYINKTVSNPEIGSIGGEWVLLGLARSGYTVPDSYYASYYANVEKYVKNCKGILDERKYTEYSRVVIGLTAAGYDPRSVGGYDLTLPLADFDKTVWQGINGPIWALIALDSLNYSIPKNSAAKVQATRDLYITEILKRQLSDGGWNLTAGASGMKISASEKAEPDVTGMALQALSKYQDKKEVKTAIDKAVKCLSELQNKNGGYTRSGIANSESVIQVIVAICELGIDINDSRFVKNNKTLVDNLLSFMNADGSFKHDTGDSGNSQMSTEQALYGLVAVQRANNGKNSLYRMSDAVKRGDFLSVESDSPTGLPNKHKDIKTSAVQNKKTFSDIKKHINQTAIEALAERGIITGKTETSFDPNATMTRAEFTAVVTRGLGLPAVQSNVFKDVTANAWYGEAVGTAYYYGIVTVGEDAQFNPNNTITRQEAAIMIARAAKLCGIDTAVNNTEVRDILAQFGDYIKSSDWAKASLSFCYREDILSQDDLDIRPLEYVKRCEVAEMFYRMLKVAKLL